MYCTLQSTPRSVKLSFSSRYSGLSFCSHLLFPFARFLFRQHNFPWQLASSEGTKYSYTSRYLMGAYSETSRDLMSAYMSRDLMGTYSETPRDLMGTHSETSRDIIGTYRRFGGTCRINFNAQDLLFRREICQHGSPIRCYISNKLHCVTSQKMFSF